MFSSLDINLFLKLLKVNNFIFITHLKYISYKLYIFSVPDELNVFDLGQRYQKEIKNSKEMYYLVLSRENDSQSISCSLVVHTEAEVKILQIAPDTTLVFNLSSKSNYDIQDASYKSIKYYIEW